MKNASTGALDEGKLQPLPGERAGLDRGAVEVRFDAVRGAPREAHLRIHAGGTVRIVDADQIGRAAVERNGEARRARQARGDLRLVIAGDEAARRNPRRPEHRLEEFSRAAAVGARRDRRAACATRRSASASPPSGRALGGVSTARAALMINAANAAAWSSSRQPAISANEHKLERVPTLVTPAAAESDEASPMPAVQPRASVRRPRSRPASSSGRGSSRRGQRSRRRGWSAARSRRPRPPGRPCRASR